MCTNIDQTSVNSLHGLLNCEIGGLDCRVITTEYRTRVHCIHMYHLFWMRCTMQFIREYLVNVLIQYTPTNVIFTLIYFLRIYDITWHYLENKHTYTYCTLHNKWYTITILVLAKTRPIHEKLRENGLSHVTVMARKRKVTMDQFRRRNVL